MTNAENKIAQARLDLETNPNTFDRDLANQLFDAYVASGYAFGSGHILSLVGQVARGVHTAESVLGIAAEGRIPNKLSRKGDTKPAQPWAA